MTTPPSGTPAPRAPRGRWLKHYVPPILAAIVSCALTYFFAPSRDAVAATTPEPTGKITSLDGKPVGQHLVLTGWIKNVPPGYGLRIFIENTANNRFYPAYSACEIEGDGTSWHCPEVRPVPDGTPAGQSRIVHVVLVTADGADEIARYREKKDAGDHGFALSGLTDGAIDLMSATVISAGS